MKNTFLFLLGFLFLLSCDNTEFSDSPEELQVELVLKKMELLVNGANDTYLNNYFFNTLGKPTHMNLSGTGTSLSLENVEVFNYDDNEDIESWKAEIPSFEQVPLSPFTYQNGQLTNIVRTGSSLTPTSCNFSYLESSIEVDIEPLLPLVNYTSKIIFNFSDTIYETLLSIEYYEEDNPVVDRKLEFEYDQQGNISNIVDYRFDVDSNQLELSSSLVMTYDDKVNPFRRLFNENPLIIVVYYVLRPANYSVFERASLFTPNNILSYDKTNSVSNLTKNFSYTYNEFDHPISSVEESSWLNLTTNDLIIYAPRIGTYTYYE